MPMRRLPLLWLGLAGCRPVELPVATPNDHWTAAGTTSGGQVTVALEARAAPWRPADDVQLELVQQGQPVTWRILAKPGAGLVSIHVKSFNNITSVLPVR